MSQLRVTCPSCSVTLKVNNPSLAGKRIKCPKCAAVFPVPAAGEGEDEPAREAAPARARVPDDEDGGEERPARRAARARDEEEDEAPRARKKAAPPDEEEPPRRKKAGPRRDEEDEEDEAPRRKKGAGKKSGGGVKVAALVGGLAVLLLAGAGAMWALGVFGGGRQAGPGSPGPGGPADKGTPPAPSLVGVWRVVPDAADAGKGPPPHVEFTEDKKVIFRNGDLLIRAEGTWSLDGDKVSTDVGGPGGKETFKILKLTDKELHVEEGRKGERIRLERVEAPGRPMPKHRPSLPPEPDVELVPPEARYPTPQAVFDAFSDANARGEYRKLLGCYTPAGQRQQVSISAIQGFDKLRNTRATKDPKQRELLMKHYRPVFDVMARHGLSEEATKGLEYDKTPDRAERMMRTLLALVKDRAAFFVDYNTAEDGGKRRPDAIELIRQRLPKLADVKISGDRAVGVLIDGPSRRPIEFIRLNGGWRIAPEVRRGPEPD